MNPRLKQAINGHNDLINQDPQQIAYQAEGTGTDGWGNPTGTTTKYFTARISHEGSRPNSASTQPAGVSTDLRYYMSMRNDWPLLAVGTEITDESGKLWKIDRYDPLRIAGSIYGYQAALLEVV
jgi:hypothetical protein